MTFVGKVLIVVQLVLAICFMAFAGAVYTAQSNWYAKANDYKKQAEQARADASATTQQLTQTQADLGAKITKFEQQVALLEGQVKTATDQLARTQTELQEARTAVDQQTAVANLAEENATARREEALRQRDRNERLQSQISELLVKNRENEDALFAKNLEIESMQARHQEMIDQLATYRQILLASNMSLNPEDYENLVSTTEPPPTVTGRVLDTEVSKTSGTEFVEISLGEDDGFKKGQTLYVYRGDRYLGKIRLSRTFPDKAIGQVVQRVRNGKIQKGDNVTPKL